MRLAQLKHQLATPLTNIWWELEHLQIGGKLDHHQQLKSILTQLQIVLDLIRPRDVQELKYVNFSPDSVIRQILADYRKPYGVRCHFHSGSKRLLVYGCPDLFAEIVINLINNAAEAYNHNHAKRDIIIDLLPAMQGITIVVGDHGQGMYWWQKIVVGLRGISFKKIKSGLGLYRVNHLLHHQFHGDLRLISRFGKGTLAVVYLPL
jgi:signal transduction histidine kinase